MRVTDPHASQPLRTAGDSLDLARVAVILFHGRGSEPASMLSLTSRLDLDGCAVLAPTAANGRWYAKSFLEPPEANEPDLSSALGVASRLVEACRESGIPTERIVIGGFSQGACLASEWVARNPASYGALVALSGGLLGPLGALPEHPGSLQGTPVLLGCSEADPWIPLQRVHESRAELERMGAAVDLRLFPGAEHAIRDDEVDAFDALLRTVRG